MRMRTAVRQPQEGVASTTSGNPKKGLSPRRGRMITGISAAVLSAAMIVGFSACGQAPVVEAPGTPPASAPAAAPANPATAPAKPAATLSLVEPTDGVFAGHIDLFRWTATEGADGYVVRVLGSDGRVVFESPVLTVTEARLPRTVALEPEAHTWSVTARKGGDVIATSPIFKFSITP